MAAMTRRLSLSEGARPGVTQARTTFAIRTVLSRGPVPLTHWH